jgi:hypothetical protein
LRLSRNTIHVFYATFIVILNYNSCAMGEQYPIFE